ncbi:MAG TPA: amidohydrolase family protein [Actinomycetota bacterium]|nr:amidohydrolase family protein [Actinomycetota bacterium]
MKDRLRQDLIIDAHCHYGKGDGLRGPWDTSAPLGRYLEQAREYGIDKTILFSAFHSNYTLANRAVARRIAKSPDRFYGFAFVHPIADAGRVLVLVREFVEQHGFCGIKVHRHDARITREICDVARLYKLPVLYDVMGEVSAVELLATEYRDVNFIIPHLGSFSDDWRAQMSMIDQLQRHPNVYTDTSGIRRFDILEKAFKRAGARKFIFGSDGPWLHPGVELEKVYAMHLDRADERDVLALNIMRLISRVRRQPRGSPKDVHRAAAARARARPGAIAVTEELRDPWAGEQFPVG